MHMQGNPQNMQNNPSYENVTLEIIQYLAQRIKIAHDNNIVDIIVDPGFGFGKTLEHNFEILNNLLFLFSLFSDFLILRMWVLRWDFLASPCDPGVQKARNLGS